MLVHSAPQADESPVSMRFAASLVAGLVQADRFAATQGSMAGCKAQSQKGSAA